MEVLYVLIPLSVALAAGFTVACLRAIRGGQFDDMESPRWRMLFEPPAAGSAPRDALNPEAKERRSKAL